MKRVLRDYAQVSLKPEELDGRIDFVRIFGRDGPVHIDVGTGRATFLLSQAKAQPEVNFLGIEWANKYYRYAVDRIGRWGLANVRIIRTDVQTFIAEFVPDSSVDFYHIYFPDPWPKKRHHKRRFIKAENLNQISRTLKAGGIVQIATDHEDYYQVIEELLIESTDALEWIDFVPAASAKEGEFVGTNYERKYIEDSRAVYTIAVRKKSD
jgi:tRNA (guanine-N7-)-methyltransferase